MVVRPPVIFHFCRDWCQCLEKHSSLVYCGLFPHLSIFSAIEYSALLYRLDALAAVSPKYQSVPYSPDVAVL